MMTASVANTLQPWDVLCTAMFSKASRGTLYLEAAPASLSCSWKVWTYPMLSAQPYQTVLLKVHTPYISNALLQSELA